MKEILLPCGRVALVDDDKFDTVVSYSWCYDRGYAITRKRVEGKSSKVYMHRLVMGSPEGCVGHKDGNKLNNQTENLVISYGPISIKKPCVSTKEKDLVRFWNSTKSVGECTEWTLSTCPDGYGKFSTWTGEKQLYFRAHRWIYEITNNIKLPAEVIIRHKCDNPKCVNLEHLETGSQVDNINDQVVRGRNLKGEQVANSVLTDKQAREAKDLYSSGVSQKELCSKYGVSKTVIYSLVHNKTYRHI